MTELSVPVLTVIIFLPIVAAVIILLLPRNAKDLARGIAITTALACFFLGLVVYTTYNGEVEALAQEQAQIMSQDTNTDATQAFQATLAFEDQVEWLPQLGISYHVAVDGLSAPMVLLTGMVFVAGVLVSWKIEDRVREFMAFFLLLVAGVYGVFMAMDLFVLFFFYELAIFPMYLLIATYGWVKLREYAAMKLTLYILIGSVIALIGAIAMVLTASNYFQSPDGAVVFQQAISSGLLPANSQPFSFSIPQINLAAENGAFSALGYAGVPGLSFATLWFPAIFLGFAVLAGIFPFHNWSPDGHVAAPTAVSMIHAGVLMKLGAYAALRVGVQLLPGGAEVHLPWIIILATVNVIYGAFIAFRQRDFKYVIGFSSVSHMGLVSLGWATMNLTGFTGAGLQMFSHGVMTALFFGCVGMVYDRAHTRDIPSLGGFVKVMPWVAFAFILGGLASMGMPGFSGFIAELPIFMGLFEASPVVTLQVADTTISNYYSLIAIIAILGVVITAAYVLRVTGQVFFGEFDRQKYPDVGNITARERFVLIFLGAPLIILGVMPALMAPMLQVGVAPVLAMLGGGT